MLYLKGGDLLGVISEGCIGRYPSHVHMCVCVYRQVPQSCTCVCVCV